MTNTNATAIEIVTTIQGWTEHPVSTPDLDVLVYWDVESYYEDGCWAYWFRLDGVKHSGTVYPAGETPTAAEVYAEVHAQVGYQWFVGSEDGSRSVRIQIAER